VRRVPQVHRQGGNPIRVWTHNITCGLAWDMYVWG
jgi:hypothetical protein